RGMRPKGGGEPGVEDVGVLLKSMKVLNSERFLRCALESGYGHHGQWRFLAWYHLLHLETGPKLDQSRECLIDMIVPRAQANLEFLREINEVVARWDARCLEIRF